MHVLLVVSQHSFVALLSVVKNLLKQALQVSNYAKVIAQNPHLLVKQAF